MGTANALTLVNRKAQIQKTDQFAEILERFIASQDVKQSSRALYRRTLKQFFTWLQAAELPLNSVTRVEVLRYKEDLTTRGMSSLTIGSYLTAVRKFFEWSEANRIYPNVAKGIKTPKRKQTFRKQALTVDQTVNLLAHFRIVREGGARDFAIISLLLRTGLRTIELVNADIGDITFKSGKRVLLVQGKGEIEKNNFVILTEKTHRAISDYLATRPKALSSEPLFISVSNNNLGRRLTTRTISKIAKDGLRAIGLDSKHLSAHSLRHTLAVSILRAGGSLADAQGVLRHANPATTQIYTRSIEEELRIKNAPEELIENVY